MSQRSAAPSSESYLRGRALHVTVAAASAIALIGLMVGMRPWDEGASVPGAVIEEEEAAQPAAEDVMEARSYGELRTRPLRAGHPGASELEAKAIGPLGMSGPVIPREEARQRALDERSERRAYEGAPPVIPHPVAERGPLACMACHDQGIRVGAEIAPPMGHEFRESCTQCHVRRESSLPSAERNPDALPLENGFAGLRASGGASPPRPGAPAGIPHTTHMRERCDSCHGMAGREGLRTPHPWRSSCTQCHAPSAAMEQAPRGPASAERAAGATAPAAPKLPTRGQPQSPEEGTLDER